MVEWKKDEKGRDSGIFDWEAEIFSWWEYSSKSFHVYCLDRLVCATSQRIKKKRHQAFRFCQGAAIARKSNLWKRRQSRGSFLNTRIQSGPSWTSNHDKQIPHAYSIIIIEHHYRASYTHTHLQLPIQLLPASQLVLLIFRPRLEGIARCTRNPMIKSFINKKIALQFYHIMRRNLPVNQVATSLPFSMAS